MVLLVIVKLITGFSRFRYLGGARNKMFSAIVFPFSTKRNRIQPSRGNSFEISLLDLAINVSFALTTNSKSDFKTFLSVLEKLIKSVSSLAVILVSRSETTF